jgi:hypothetical protein
VVDGLDTDPSNKKGLMRILVVGAGVIGSVYAAKPTEWYRVGHSRLSRPTYSRLSEIARSRLMMDATYRGQIMAPWVRKLTTSPPATSNE